MIPTQLRLLQLNDVRIVGRLTRDPELRHTAGGQSVCSIRLAVSSRGRDEGGNWSDRANYFDVTVFGRQAETVAQYIKKGGMLMVEGRIQTRSWDDKDGKKQYRTEIVADRVQFGPKAGATTGSANFQGSGDAQDMRAPQAPKDVDVIEYPDDDINAEDIPF